MTLTAQEMRTLTSSATSEWATPRPLFERWDDRYHFTLDVCATAMNAKCARWFGAAQNGLEQDWGREVCWMNPPYGDEIACWVRKARDSALRGATVVCLLPARTDTRWWHRYVYDRRKPYFRRWVRLVEFLPGRVTFLNASKARNAAPFPSAIVVFGSPTEEKPCSR